MTPAETKRAKRILRKLSYGNHSTFTLLVATENEMGLIPGTLDGMRDIAKEYIDAKLAKVGNKAFYAGRNIRF